MHHLTKCNQDDALHRLQDGGNAQPWTFRTLDDLSMKKPIRAGKQRLCDKKWDRNGVSRLLLQRHRNTRRVDASSSRQHQREGKGKPHQDARFFVFNHAVEGRCSAQLPCHAALRLELGSDRLAVVAWLLALGCSVTRARQKSEPAVDVCTGTSESGGASALHLRPHGRALENSEGLACHAKVHWEPAASFIASTRLGRQHVAVSRRRSRFGRCRQHTAALGPQTFVSAASCKEACLVS